MPGPTAPPQGEDPRGGWRGARDAALCSSSGANTHAENKRRILCTVQEVSQYFPLGLAVAVSSAFLLRRRKYLLAKLFSIVVFGSIVNEGYVNKPNEMEEYCIYNRNQNACNYGVTVGVLAFLSCLLYLALDVYFPQISSVKDRKKAVLSDIGVSGFWAFLWFVSFCFLADQWRVSKREDNPLNEGADAARAAIAFSFFSIFTWGCLTYLAFRRLGEITFQEEYNTLFPSSPPVLP